MGIQRITGLQIYAILSLLLCCGSGMLCSVLALLLAYFGAVVSGFVELLGGVNRLEADMRYVLMLLTGYSLACLGMSVAAIGLLLRQRWGRILAYISLIPILSISAYAGYYFLPLVPEFFWRQGEYWMPQVALLLLPAVMVLYGLWGMVALRRKVAN